MPSVTLLCSPTLTAQRPVDDVLPPAGNACGAQWRYSSVGA